MSTLNRRIAIFILLTSLIASFSHAQPGPSPIIRNQKDNCSSDVFLGLFCCQTTDGACFVGDGTAAQPMGGSGSFTEADTLQTVKTRGRFVTDASQTNPVTVCNSGTSNCTGVNGINLYVDSGGAPHIETFDTSGNPSSQKLAAYSGGTTGFTIDNAGSQVNCLTIDAAGLITFASTESCRPAMVGTFTAAMLEVDGTNCVANDVALNSFPAKTTISCADNDNGRMVLPIHRTPAKWDAGTIDVLLTAQSITNQNTLTIVVDMQVVCTASGEQRAAAPATGTTNTATITFGNQTNDVRHSNVVSIATSGCSAGEELYLIMDNEDAGSATQSITTGVITGGMIVLYAATSR